MKIKTFLFILIAFSIYATTGDISSVAINPDGYSISITISGLDSGGTYNYGFSTNHTPGASTPFVGIKRLGYDSIGFATTLIDTVYIDTTLRKTYPHQTADSEVISGSDVIITCAMSDYVFSKDTIKSINIPVNWYTKINPNNVYSASSVTNNSTAVYPKVVGNWSMYDRSRVGSTFQLFAKAYHRSGRLGKPVRAVKFSVIDQHTDTVIVWSRSMTIDSTMKRKDSIPIAEYIASISTSTLTVLDTLVCNFIAYPWYGDSASCLNTADLTFGYPSVMPTKQVYTNDKNNTYGVTCNCVDSVNGVDANGHTVDTLDFAENHDTLTCYKHIGAAMTGIKTYNNTNHSRNNSGGGYIYLKQGPHSWVGSTVTLTNGTCFLTITNFPGTTRIQDTIVGQRGSNGEGFILIKNVFAQFQSGIGYPFNWTTGVNNKLVFDSCYIAILDAATPHEVINLNYYWNTIPSHALGLKSYTNHNTQISIRGNDLTGLSTNMSVYNIIGNRSFYNSTNNLRVSTYITSQGNRLKKNFLFTDNIFHNNDNSAAASLNFYEDTPDSSNDSGGAAIINNLITNRTGTQPILRICGDNAANNNINNILIWNNTIIGERFNFCYNDIGTTPIYRKYWSVHNNVFDKLAIKSDVYTGTPNGNRTGNWSQLFGTGNSYDIIAENKKVSVPGNFLLEFKGIGGIQNTTPSDSDYFKFTDNGSNSGTALGGGDFTLMASSPAKRFSKLWLLPYDIAGNKRGPQASGDSLMAAGAYAYGGRRLAC